MQTGQLQHVSPEQTITSPLVEAPLSSGTLPVSSPSIASSPPPTSEVSNTDITSLSDIQSQESNFRINGSLPKDLILSQQQTLLAKKIRLGKIISRESYLNNKDSRITFRPYEDDPKEDIKVLSPSVVNSQVLSKTRPLSPEPLSPLNLDSPNEINKNKTMGLKEVGNRRRQEFSSKMGRGGKEDQVIIKEDEEKDKNISQKIGKGRGRRRPRIFKLKFHHQALPPEYLDHYEASLRQEQRYGLPCPTSEDFREKHSVPLDTVEDATKSGLREGLRNIDKSKRNQRKSRPITIHEAGGGATEALLRDILLANPQLQQAALQQAAMARAQSVPSIMLSSVNHNNRMSYPNGSLPIPSPEGSVGWDDRSSLTSDMSVDDCPKRERKKKNKKEQINYLMGTGLGCAGLGNSGMDLDTLKSPTPALVAQNTSVIEGTNNRDCNSLYCGSLYQNEPLNLCVRDESSVNSSPRVSCEISKSEATCIKKENIVDEDKVDKETSPTASNHGNIFPSPPSEYSPWNFGHNYLGTVPNWIHDYRLKTEDGLSSGQSTPSLCSQSSHLSCMSPPTWPHFSPPPQMPSSPQPLLSPAPPLSPLINPNHPRNIHAFIKDSLSHRLDNDRERLSPRENFSSVNSERSSPQRPSSRASSVKSGARRKRSALFIPPNDPNTEVSICKFKFTGGANPMLEEKKMVSVDAEGTLRYFNKGERAVCKDIRNSPNLRISGKLLENLSKCEKDVKKIRLESDTDDTCSLPGGKIEAACSSVTTSPTGTLEYGIQSPFTLPTPIEDSPKRKRRSKKSSVREKLEQTLREKGLLIQTQQVESAEGATYCKFRQLRKITRYLFRSWKDYLPGQMNEGIHGDPSLHNPQSPVYTQESPSQTREYASSGQ